MTIRWPLWRTTLVLLLLAGTARALDLNETPAEPGAWGFRPPAASTLTVNPPPFTWRPVKRATAYALQVAADTAFETRVYNLDSTPWSAHCPPQTFPPGTYYWRYRAVAKEEDISDWSHPRPFTVEANAAPFPKPTIQEVTARMPREHPRLFFRPEEVAPFRKLANTTLADRFAEIRAAADRLLTKPPDITEPPKYPEGTETKGSEWKKIWWGNRQRSVAVANGAATLAFAYQLTGEKRYGAAARDLLLALCQWDSDGSTNYRYNDEAAMPLLYYPSRAYTWAYDVFTPKERQRIVKTMRERGRHCFEHLRRGKHLWLPYKSHSNRAWHWLGEVAIAFFGDIPEAAEWLDYALTIFYTCYPVWGVNDGAWHEGVSYWSSYIERFMYWALVSQAAFRIDPFDKPFFRETGYFGLYTLPPGTKTGGFGDLSPTKSSDRIGRLMAILAAGAHNPHWQWYADRHQPSIPGYFGFIFAARAGTLQAETPAGLPTSRAFPDVGLAVLNSNLLDGKQNVQVLFKSSPFGRQSHGYNANNAFLLHLRGQRALIRSGRRDVHGSPHHVKWMWSTRSDNAILVNTDGQIPHSPEAQGRITHFETTQRFDLVAGEAGASYGNRLDRWARRIFFFKPDVLLIHDVLQAPEPATYQWLLHAPGPFEISENLATWQGKPGRIAVRFLVPSDLDIQQTNRFDPPPHEWANWKLEEWHLTASANQKTPMQQFITLITIDNAEIPVAIHRDPQFAIVKMTLEDGQVSLHLGDSRFEVHGAGFDGCFEDT